MIKSLIMAFSTYSRIPMPNIEWAEKNKKYVLMFFPFVGLATGLILYLLSWISSLARLNTFFTGTILCAASILINGGIHMDGFADTVDALSAMSDRKKRLAILKDPHCGSFAAVMSGIYLLLLAGAFSHMGLFRFPGVIPVFMISRALSALSLIFFPHMDEGGMAAGFANALPKKGAAVFLSLLIFCGTVFMSLYNLTGGLSAVLVALLYFIYYRYFAMKNFGGVNGDTSGFFLQVCELIMVTLYSL
ncbi:MAG: adenosylcobinamide-GDP ribazoletransferase [Lachnospiraceae bacterium]|nr:adenosylcobinamide-GDP ribazoletransferase [Lachnospiraceae bacterium]